MATPELRNAPRKLRRAMRCNDLDIGERRGRFVLLCTNKDLLSNGEPCVTRPMICRLCASWSGPRGKKKG